MNEWTIFLSLQQNIKLILWTPILSAIFRIIFIIVYNPYPTWKGRLEICIRFIALRLWWGMDFDAYVFLIPLSIGDAPCIIIWWVSPNRRYCTVSGINHLFPAYFTQLCRKNDFYKHFHDTYNYMVHYGNHAEKRNLIDVFFNQDRGILVILGLIPITFISWYMGDFFLSLPSIPYPTIEGIYLL